MTINGQVLPTNIEQAVVGLNQDEGRALHRAHSDVLHAAAMAEFRITSPYASAAANLSAFQECIADAKNESGYPYAEAIDIGAGDYELADTLEIREAWGLKLIGRGERTKFIWTGNDVNKPVFKFPHSRQCGLERAQIHITNPAYCGIQLLRDNQAGWATTPKENTFRDLFIDCDNKASFGVVIGGTGRVDANNDFHFFENVVAYSYSQAGWMMANHMQSYGNMLLHCQMLSNGYGQYGIQAATGAGSTSANFIMIGGGMGLNTIADFYLARTYQAFVIDGVNSEGSSRLLLTVDTGGIRNICLRNGRWAGNVMNADKKAILHEGGTLFLSIDNYAIGDGQDPTGALTFDFGTANLWRKVTMNLCTIFSSAADLWDGIAPANIADGTNIKVTNEVTGTAELISS